MHNHSATRTLLTLATILLLLLLGGCDSGDSDPQIDGDTSDGDSEADLSDGDVDTADGDPDGDVDADEPADGDVDGDSDGDPESDGDVDWDDDTDWADPWTVMPTSELLPRRGYRVLRGIVHSHSPYSHDACDDEPFIDGVRNEACFEDCREGMCTTAQDFVFLSDHASLFADHEYPDVLLYKDGDTLIERGGLPVANRVNCGDDHEVIVGAGTETAMMPIGIEYHVGDTPEERKALYGRADLDAVHALQAAGAKVFLQHTEGWDIDTILALEVDGIEAYNLHQNLMDNLGKAIEMVLKLETEPENLPVPELAIIALFQESAADLERWSKASQVRRTPAVLATDAHRNVFDGPGPDGERLDSFRRMMHWFSNYVLVPSDDELDDAMLKDAIGHGRMYGAFDFLGYPIGFDFYAQSGDTIYEMGDNVPTGDAVTLHVSLPAIYRLDPTGPQPTIYQRILKAAADGQWEEVATGDGDLEFTATSGVYRAEVRIVPAHLRPWLGEQADDFIFDSIWIYANPIYVE